ncbi:MAG: DUF192 domain-containing protein [Pseudomonadota bacterium]
MRRALFLLLFFLLAVSPRPSPAGAGPLEPLTIETAAGIKHVFSVEIARTTEERARGLMFRDRLAPDGGMLFVYRADQPVSMWMKNTLIPLDMLFIARDGTIRSIAERTVPLSETIIPSQGVVAAVLEINGGTAERLGIRPGDRVRSPALATGG